MELTESRLEDTAVYGGRLPRVPIGGLEAILSSLPPAPMVTAEG